MIVFEIIFWFRYSKLKIIHYRCNAIQFTIQEISDNTIDIFRKIVFDIEIHLGMGYEIIVCKDHNPE